MFLEVRSKEVTLHYICQCERYKALFGFYFFLPKVQSFNRKRNLQTSRVLDVITENDLFKALLKIKFKGALSFSFSKKIGIDTIVSCQEKP